MKEFNNVKFNNEGKKDSEKTLDPYGKPFKNYMAVLLFAVLQPDSATQQHGFSPKESYDLYKFIDKMEPFKTKEKIEFEDADFLKLKEAFNRLKSGASREMAEMYDYLESIK